MGSAMQPCDVVTPSSELADCEVTVPQANRWASMENGHWWRGHNLISRQRNVDWVQTSRRVPDTPVISLATTASTNDMNEVGLWWCMT